MESVVFGEKKSEPLRPKEKSNRPVVELEGPGETEGKLVGRLLPLYLGYGVDGRLGICTVVSLSFSAALDFLSSSYEMSFGPNSVHMEICEQIVNLLTRLRTRSLSLSSSTF